MPFAFPSHQGLIAPLWRRWPSTFDIAALCVGAAMPDVIDGFAAVGHGHFGQGIGHSLVGLLLLGMPAGVVLWAVLKGTARRLGFLQGSGLPARAWNRGLAAFAGGARPAHLLRDWRRIVPSLAVGGFSHLCIDLISHGGFPWLMPWVPKIRIFPDWWYAVWTRIDIPGYKDAYVIGPHFMVWAFLSVLGICMLVRPAWSPALEKQSDGDLENRPPMP